MKKIISLFLVTALLLACLPFSGAAAQKDHIAQLQEALTGSASDECSARLPARDIPAACLLPSRDLNGVTFALGETIVLMILYYNATSFSFNCGIDFFKGSKESDIVAKNYLFTFEDRLTSGMCETQSLGMEPEDMKAGSYVAVTWVEDYSGNVISAYWFTFKLVTNRIELKSITLKDVFTDTKVNKLTANLNSNAVNYYDSDPVGVYVTYNPANASGSREKWVEMTNPIAWWEDLAGEIYFYPIAPGRSTVTVYVNEKSATFELEVTGTVYFQLDHSFLSLKAGQQTKLTPLFTPAITSYACAKNWRTNNSSVAEVWSDGTVIAKAPGTAIITFTGKVGEYTYTATCKVSVPEEGDLCADFTDVERDAWYHAAVDFTLEQGLMGSTDPYVKTYEPYTKVSRAMVASILYRMAGSPEGVEYSGAFTDVPKDQWFATAVEWCAQNGLASGKGDGTFDPNGDVTRQELAVFMKKMAEFTHRSVTEAAELTDFPDGASVQTWAAPYLQWAVAMGLITGKGQEDGSVLLAPEATAMRCELASILQRFLALEPEPEDPPEPLAGTFNERLIAFLDGNGFEDKSYAVSPLSLRAALALALAGATGETERQLLAAMGFASQEEAEAWYKTVRNGVQSFEDFFASPSVAGGEDAAYRVVNSAWRNEASDGSYLEDYLEKIRTVYGADAFSAPAAELADKINAWVNEQTEGLIPKIVGDEAADMAAILANALYLKTGWDVAFDDAEALDFTCADGTVTKKDAIRTEARLSYYEDEDARLAVIPLQGGIKMAVVLGECDDLGTLLSASEPKTVALTMPTLDLDTGFEKGELCSFLKAQGCERIFTPDAELDAMFTTPIFLSNIIQKVRVTTDKDGLEAAAATVMEFPEAVEPEPEEPVVFTLDKTFTFYIFNGSYAAPELLFFGREAD